MTMAERIKSMHRFRCFWIVFIVISVVVLPLFNQLPGVTSGTLEEEKRKVEKTREEVVELEKVLKALEDSIKNRQNRIEELNREFRETELQIQLLETELAQSESRLEEKNRLFAARIRSAYMNGRLSYLEVFLDVESFGDVIVRMAYLTRILNRDAELITAIKEEQTLIRERKTAMAKQRHRLQDLRNQLEGENRNLADQRREKDILLVSTKKKLAVELARITPQAERKPVYGIVIDNYPRARPQHGLARATVIYEYEVEGGVTRYLALFSAFPTKVGPIRSARTHNIILAMENGVNFIYASAGYDVLQKIKDWNVKGTNALRSESSSFYRDPSRKAPHNLYVNLATLGVEEPSKEVVIRPAYLSRKGNDAIEISPEYSSSYSVKYEFISNKGVYRRYVNGEIHRDATGEGILARNIIVQYVPYGIDLLGRPTPDLVGEGIIEFYSQGQHFKGTWKKDNRNSPTSFFYQDWQEIERVYGQTWIQIMRIPKE